MTAGQLNCPASSEWTDGQATGHIRDSHFTKGKRSLTKGADRQPMVLLLTDASDYRLLSAYRLHSTVIRPLALTNPNLSLPFQHKL